MATSSIYIFTVEKVVLPGEKPWDPAASKRLASTIAAKVIPDIINIFKISAGSNLIRIVEGLSKHKLQLETAHEKVPHPLNNLPVVYLGSSAEIEKCKAANASRTVIAANLIQVGHFVALSKDFQIVYISDQEQHLISQLNK
jgi:hypothetical protein